MITIFTPTYNRAYSLTKLYETICAQTYKDFEWLIVDDGSFDNTEDLISGFIEERRIAIRYIKQLNGGKHRAINRGVLEARGDIFMIADSDDYLIPESLFIIKDFFRIIEKDNNYAGVCGLMCYPSGEIIGTGLNQDTIITTALDIRMKYKVKGDLCEIFKTEILKNFPFPEYENEKFCPEALVWYRIAERYNLLYFNQVIYVREYLPGGLTSKMARIRMDSPKASLTYYSELSQRKIPVVEKIKAYINYWRFSFRAEETFYEKLCNISSVSLLFFPISYILHLIDKSK